MSRRRGGKSAKPKPCAYCGVPLPAQRPVYLVESTAGRIVGPYHAGCAERIALAAKKGPPPISAEATEYGTHKWTAREETLPW